MSTSTGTAPTMSTTSTSYVRGCADCEVQVDAWRAMSTSEPEVGVVEAPVALSHLSTEMVCPFHDVRALVVTAERVGIPSEWVATVQARPEPRTLDLLAVAVRALDRLADHLDGGAP